MKKKLKVKSCTMTCSACPSQWDLYTVDDKYIYCRFRGGHLTVELKAFTDDEKLLYEWQDDDIWNGIMTTDELIEHTKHILDWSEYLLIEKIRLYPQRYLGKLGDGSCSDDGIYFMLKEVLKNSIEEYETKADKQIELQVTERNVIVRDYGDGMPLSNIHECVTKAFPVGMCDTTMRPEKWRVGGLKIVNALSWKLAAQAFCDGLTRRVEYKQGRLVKDTGIIADPTNAKCGTLIEFEPDASSELFEGFKFHEDYIEAILRNYIELYNGLVFLCNGRHICSDKI